jgi:hypothetical protein
LTYNLKRSFFDDSPATSASIEVFRKDQWLNIVALGITRLEALRVPRVTAVANPVVETFLREGDELFVHLW